MITYLSIALNFLVIVAFIIDRIYRISSIKEFKEAKAAQIESLKQHIELSEKSNDSFVTDRLKKRIEDLQSIILAKEEEIEKNKSLILHSVTQNHDDNKLLEDDYKRKIDGLELEISNLKADESEGKYMLLLHGLRAPTATLIGLMNLYELEDIDVEEIMKYVKKSISELDSAIINFIENFKK